MKNLNEIDNLGGIDADSDDLLIKCFQDHDSYKQILKFEKFLILGRKGTGKTAIFKKILIEKSFDTFTYGHTFSDYPWHYHDLQIKQGVPDYDKYTQSWKYFILLTIAKIVLNYDQSLPLDNAAHSLDYLSRIESFIIDSYGSRDPDLTQIFTPTKRLKVNSYLKVNLGVIDGGIDHDSVKIENLPQIIQEVNKNLIEYIISSLNPEHKYYLLFDQLDLGFNPNDPEYNNRLIGLLLAAKDINIKAKEYRMNLSINIFLRDDIYGKLKFEDKNKLTEAYSTYIEWDIRGNHTLKELIEKRLTEVLSTNDSEKVKWDDVFDETQQTTGKQSKYNYISDRTFLRPRDIIKFCNEIIAQHKITNKEGNKIDNKEVYDAKSEYSRYFLNEIDDEIHKHIENYEDFLDIIKRLGYYQFKFSDFEETFNSMDVFKKSSIVAINILKSLYEFSIIGYYSAGGRGFGGSEYVFKYKDYKINFDENATMFRVHPGLVETLALKRTTK